MRPTVVSLALPIPHDTAGLALIVEISRGNLRDMLTRIEQIAHNGDGVTEIEVRTLFKLDFVDTLVNWMRAALAADRQRQVDIIDAWSDFASAKVEAIEAFLVFLFMAEILRLYRENRVMQGILPADREWIVSQMRARATAAGMTERKFWQEAVDFWTHSEGKMTEAALFAKVLKFDEWLNIDRATAGAALPVRTT